MTRIATRLVERDEQPFPGLAHVSLTCADGVVVELWDKEPVIGIEDGVQVGDVVLLDCDVVGRAAGTVTVRLRHGIGSVAGEDTFEVARTLVH